MNRLNSQIYEKFFGIIAFFIEAVLLPSPVHENALQRGRQTLFTLAVHENALQREAVLLPSPVHENALQRGRSRGTSCTVVLLSRPFCVKMLS